MKIKFLLFYFLLFIAVRLNAQIPSGYYNSAQGLTGAALKTALHNIIKNHTVASYNSLWNHFEDTDKKTNGKVWDIYSDLPDSIPPYQFTFSSDQCGSYNSEADCYNREHTWPQSWFNSDNGPSSDLFHIYPTDGYVNNLRSNYPYGDVNIASWTSQNGSKLGSCADAGYSQTVFEPIDEYKGDLARSYFYMSTRYQGDDASWGTSGATNKSSILPWQVDVLLNWHHQDTVSSKEISRNNAIYQIQDNRNPFIDNPQWVDSIWVPTFTFVSSPYRDIYTVNVYPNPVSEKLFISEKSKNESIKEIRIFNMLGQEVEHIDHQHLQSSTVHILDCTSWNNGIYYIHITGTAHVNTIKLIKN